MHTIKLSSFTASQACKDHREKDLYFYLVLRAHYNSGVIFDIKKKFHFFKFKFGYRTYLRRIDALLSHGWARIEKNKFILIGKDKLPKNEYYFEKHWKFTLSNFTEHIIRLIPCKTYQTAQEKKSKKNEQQKKCKYQYNEFYIVDKENGELIKKTSSSAEVLMTCRKMAKLIGRKSALTGHRIKEKGLKQEMLTYYNRYTLRKGEYLKWINGLLFTRQASGVNITLPFNPTKLKKLKAVKLDLGHAFIPCFMYDCVF